MAPLAHTLALLAMAVATAATVVFPLDMALDSFDDQYRGCGPAMTAALPALSRSEFLKNPFYARVWEKAMDEWQRRGSPVSPLPSPDHAIAIMAYTMDDCLYRVFNSAVLEAGSSPQQYRDNFHFKSLHFLLTDALATLRDAREGQCLDVFGQYCGYQFLAQCGDTVQTSQFFVMSLNKTTDSECTVETQFQVHTCHSAGMQSFSQYPGHQWVLIPPFETFQVTEVTQEGDKTQIQLNSTGTFSKYNCEWLQGGSVSMAPFHLGGLLLATTALAVATGIL